MRKIAILGLADDAVRAVKAGIQAEHGPLLSVVGVAEYSTDIHAAVEQLKGVDFDTLVLVTHGTPEQMAPDGDVAFLSQTAIGGPLALSNFYELAMAIEPLLEDQPALVALCCFSNQRDFRDATDRFIPGLSIASIGTITVSEAIAGTVEFCRATANVEVSQGASRIVEVNLKEIFEHVFQKSFERMDGWIPPSDYSSEQLNVLDAIWSLTRQHENGQWVKKIVSFADIAEHLNMARFEENQIRNIAVGLRLRAIPPQFAWWRVVTSTGELVWEDSLEAFLKLPNEFGTRIALSDNKVRFRDHSSALAFDKNQFEAIT